MGKMHFLFHWRSIFRSVKSFFGLGLILGLIYFFGRIVSFLYILRNEIVTQWNSSDLNQIILQESNLEGLLLGNVLLLLFFGGYLAYNIISGIITQFNIYVRHSKKVADPFPLRSSLFLGLLLGVQWIILIDLLEIFDTYDVVVYGQTVEFDNFLSQFSFLVDPFPIHFVIIGNAILTIITISIIFRKSRIGRYIRDRTMFTFDDRFISHEYFKEIINEEDPILKNLRITQAYTDLSIGMSHLLGNRNTNWATYASWASKTAGQSIRKEEIPRLAKRFLVDRLPLADFFNPDKTDPEIQDLDDTEIMWNMYILGVIEDISLSISRGNLKVFAELGPIFSSFIRSFRDHKQYDEDALLQFQQQFTPGKTEDDGQDLIKEAFSRYYRAMFIEDPKTLAEMMLLSNIQIGYHEQIRLQEAIETAVTAPLRHGYDVVMADKLASLTPIFKDRFRSTIQNKMESNQENYHIFVKGIITSIMVLEIPGRKLVLGENVPKYSRFHSFPPDLRDIIDLTLRGTIEKFDPDIDSLDDSRAYDWADLQDRLGYIVDLFRTTQQTREMFSSTFTLNQTLQIYVGKIPTGRL